MLPDHAPREYQDRAILWNAVEKIEKAKNSQLAREVQFALPKELTAEQNLALVREYVQRHFVSVGMCADFAIHDTKKGNPHVHIMLTTRPIEPCGKWGGKQKKEYILDKNSEKIYNKKTRQYKCKSIPATDWNEQTKAEVWREGWAVAVNAELERHNHAERVDHRSYERQGIDKVPTVHLGTAAHQMERKGIRTERGNINRAIEITNQNLRQLKAQIGKLQKWLNELPKEPSLAEVMQAIFNRRSGLRHLKYSAEILAFLQGNKIRDMAGLDEKLTQMYATQFDLRDKLKPIERRLKALDEHLTQAAAYRKTKSPQSKAYLDRHLNGRKVIPIKSWRTERERLLADKQALNQQYQTLKRETDNAYKIKRGVYDIMQAEQRTTAHEMER
ncbi:MAG: MobA/MobL family protein [Oscillospiraceae bacterium]|nr:MobA/MobL family protein [Oscillospiraceae bacterium]